MIDIMTDADKCEYSSWWDYIVCQVTTATYEQLNEDDGQVDGAKAVLAGAK